MKRTVAGHFSSTAQAEAALAELEAAGLGSNEVNYIATDEQGDLQKRAQGKVETESGTAKGTAIGGVSGLLLGLAAVTVPGVGPLLAAGPITAALAGAGVGAATGGLLGALADMGVPQRDVEGWADRLRKGGSLIFVRGESHVVNRADEILRRHSAKDVSAYDEPAQVPESRQHEPANFGDEGGSSQWGQKVLHVDEDGKSRVAERTHSRDTGSERLD